MESSVNRHTLSGQDGQLVRSCCAAWEPSLALAHDLEGWEGKGRKAAEGGDVCIIMAHLRCPMVKTNTML